MSNSIEIIKVVAQGDTIKYEICDRTGLNLLQKEKVEAWVKYYNMKQVSFELEHLPESVLLLPLTLYVMPITWFYGVDLIVPSIDKVLYECLPDIYEAYSKVYGPFQKEWMGEIKAKAVVSNEMPASRYDHIIFYSGGVDAVHAGVNFSGKRSVLVSVPSIESAGNKTRIGGQVFIEVKEKLLKDFSAISESDWLMVTNNFRNDVFNDARIHSELHSRFGIDSPAYHFDGWFGIKYLGNLLSTAPFAYALGIPNMVLGSSYEQLEELTNINLDGSNPDLSDAIKFAGVSFTEQDGLYTRRSLKVKNIVDWCRKKGEYAYLRVCFNDTTDQCGTCAKCVRTQLNLLCAGENPKRWGFDHFDEKRFSKYIRGYNYIEKNICWIWDIVDSIDEMMVYPCCNELLHWLKKQGYKTYFSNVQKAILRRRLMRVYKYPYYAKKLAQRVFGNLLMQHRGGKSPR